MTKKIPVKPERYVHQKQLSVYTKFRECISKRLKLQEILKKVLQQEEILHKERNLDLQKK